MKTYRCPECGHEYRIQTKEQVCRFCGEVIDTKRSRSSRGAGFFTAEVRQGTKPEPSTE